MHVAALECRGFRNLADARVPLGPGITVFHGPNGAGKTNLLEALYFGLAARSFRSRQRPRHDRASSRPRPGSSWSSPARRGRRLLAALDRNGERRHRLDGRPLGSPGAGERPLVSVFHPDRMELVKGPAARRRGHLDRLVGGAVARPRGPARALRQDPRAAQRAGRPRPGGAADAGRAGDLGRAPGGRGGAADRGARRGGRGAERAGRERGGAELGIPGGLEIRYRPRTAPDRDAIAAELAAAPRPPTWGAPTPPTARSWTRSSCGWPNGRCAASARRDSSGSALLALLFAERAALIEAGRPAPLMLLDDVMSELDPERRELLVGDARLAPDRR